MTIAVSSNGRRISVVTIDNPSKANAMSREALAELAGVWQRLDADDACRAIVVTGAGDRAFTAGGIALLLATDVRYAAPYATFGLPQVKWAIYPLGGAAAKLVHQIGHVHAMKLLLTAQNIDADEAVRIGLVNEVVPSSELMTRAMATAEIIAANSPMAVQAVKRFVSLGIAEAAAERETFEQSLGDAVRASADFTEGVSAFRERRQPTYE